ncbi:MAG: hypothetical protein NTV62_02585 [Candidatus Gribaldobacteria bacterium]|nr:hypothetical protein [Candidatus Gribaldobacteria bacterium]
MIPLKYSFKLLPQQKVEEIRFDSRLKAFIFKEEKINAHIISRAEKEKPSVLKLKKNSQKLEELEVENKKRVFLKLAGVVGLGAVASLLIPRKADALVFGSTPAANVVGVKNTSNAKINPATEETLSALNDKIDSPYGALIVGNAQKKFRDGFAIAGTQPDPAVWDLVNPTTNHIITQGGNTFSSAYLRISLSPFNTDSEVSLTTIETFGMAFRAGFGVSISQRIIGQEVGMEIVGVADTTNVVETISAVVDVAMPASVVVATANTCPIVFATPHNFHGGDRVVIYGCLDSRVNAGPVIITVVDSVTISVPITLATATYTTTGGYIKWADPVAYTKNAASLLTENATATNASFITRRNGSSFRLLSSTIATTTATQGNTSPYTDAFLNAGNQEIYATLEEIIYRSYSPDGVATMSGLGKWTQGVPDEAVNYKMRVRAKNLKNLTVPVARITTATKTGTTTATFETDVAHGLNILDFVQVYGVRDQAAASFPNLSTAVVVTGTPTTTSFTCICGTAASVSSTGGVVWRVQGSATAPGVVAGSIQSISRTNNILSVVNGSTWATPLPGEYFQLWGMDGSAAAYDGAYKVLRVNTTTLELESTGADFGSINCGGVGFRRTDVRIHFVRVLDYTRLVTEVVGGRGNTTDINNSVPVSLTRGATIDTVTTVTTAADVTRLNNLGSASTNQQSALYVQLYGQERLNWANSIRNRIT